MSQQTVIEMTVQSDKRTASGIAEHLTQFQFELQIPYGQNNVFYQMSGGTAMNLMTINEEAAKIFQLGKKVRLTIEAIE